MTDSLNGHAWQFIDIEQPEDIVIEKSDGSAAIAGDLVKRQPELANLTFDQFVAEIQDRLDVLANRAR